MAPASPSAELYMGLRNARALLVSEIGSSVRERASIPQPFPIIASCSFSLPFQGRRRIMFPESIHEQSLTSRPGEFERPSRRKATEGRAALKGP